jgi:hypothetical protein
MAACPVESCGARLVFTVRKLPFDPASDPFELRTWEEYAAEPDRTAKVSIAERLLARIGAAFACGLLTGVVVALSINYFFRDLAVWIPFVLAVPQATLVYAAIFGQIHARDRRHLADAMRAVAALTEKQGPTVALRRADESAHSVDS